MIERLFLNFVAQHPYVALAGWGLVLLMVFVPAVAKFVYGMFGRSIEIYPKPSANAIAAAKVGTEQAVSELGIAPAASVQQASKADK